MQREAAPNPQSGSGQGDVRDEKVRDKDYDGDGAQEIVIAVNDKYVSLSADHLIKDFLDLQARLGRRPKIMEYRRHCHSPKALDRVFGKPGWRRLIEAVGKQAMPKNILNAAHLIRDYLDTEQAIGRKPGYTHFHARHRHSLKVLVRVFGKPGWTNLRKAAAAAKRKKIVFAEEQCTGAETAMRWTKRAATARTEREILKDIRATYRALSRAIRTLGEKKITEKVRKKAGKLRNRLHELFYEAGRAISVEEAFQ